jgi:hypothetical protein
MRFSIGEVIMDVIVGDDDFELPLRDFLPGLDLPALGSHHSLLEPDFVDLGRDILKRAVQTFVLRPSGRSVFRVAPSRRC